MCVRARAKPRANMDQIYGVYFRVISDHIFKNFIAIRTTNYQLCDIITCNMSSVSSIRFDVCGLSIGIVVLRISLRFINVTERPIHYRRVSRRELRCRTVIPYRYFALRLWVPAVRVIITDADSPAPHLRPSTIRHRLKSDMQYFVHATTIHATWCACHIVQHSAGLLAPLFLVPCRCIVFSIKHGIKQSSPIHPPSPFPPTARRPSSRSLVSSFICHFP